jgi:hypothetical protein
MLQLRQHVPPDPNKQADMPRDSTRSYAVFTPFAMSLDKICLVDSQVISVHPSHPLLLIAISHLNPVIGYKKHRVSFKY